jgi:hypothetical protein
MAKYTTFEDLLDDLVQEESEPTYEALVRWQERCPDWRLSLEEYFAVWMMQREEVDDLPEIDDEAIVAKGVEYAMSILREQGRLIPDDHIEPVSDFDQMTLTAIYILHGRGDAIKVADKMGEMAGKEFLLGAILMSLTRLEEKHLIESWESDPVSSERAGKSNRHFNITIAGERALAYAKETSRVLSGLLGDFA